MKRFLHTIAIFILSVSFGAGLVSAQPKITFEKTEHNFGSFLKQRVFKLPLLSLKTQATHR
jgi:hypothetical protein